MNILPSTKWLTFGKELWGYCRPREKWVIVWGIIVPVISQFMIVCSFGVAMRATMAGVRGELSEDWRGMLTVAILVVFSVSAWVQWLKVESEIKRKEVCGRLVRDLLASRYMSIGFLNKDEKNVQDKGLKKSKRLILKKGPPMLIGFIEMVSCLLTTSALVLVMIYIFPVIGILVVVVGISALFFLRRGTRPAVEPSAASRKELLQDLSGIEKDLMAGGGCEAPVADLRSRYRANLFDSMMQEVVTSRKRKEGQIAGMVSAAAAILITITFYVLSGKHQENLDPVLMLVFVFALRISVSKGRTALSKWYGLLREKSVLLAMLRISRNEPAKDSQ